MSVLTIAAFAGYTITALVVGGVLGYRKRAKIAAAEAAVSADAATVKSAVAQAESAVQSVAQSAGKKL